MSQTSSSTYTIGFFTTGTELEYSSLLSHTVETVAAEKGVNLINFLGGSLNPNFSFSQYKYQYQCNVAFSFADTQNIDGIILASGILSSFLDSKEFETFYNQYAPLPMVSLGVNIEGLPSVYTDNKIVFRTLVDHLINIHNKHKIAFVSGPSSNTDALNRYAGYIDALADNHIAFNSDYVFIGDFTPPSGIEAVRIFLDEKKLDIDAIVCANDSMALAVMAELKKRAYSVPDTIMVTGCDNIPSSAYCVPSLTTIEQALEDSVRAAFDLLLNQIQGKTVTNTIIPSKMVYRESCGCNMISHTSLVEATANLHSPIQASALALSFLERCSLYLPPEVITAATAFVMSCYHIVFSPPDTLLSPKSLINDFFKSLRKTKLSLHIILNLKNCISALKKDLLNFSYNITTVNYIEDTLEQIIHELFNDIFEYYGTQTERLNHHFAFIRQFLLTITQNINDKKEQLLSIMPGLMDCGIYTCLIYLYPHEITHNLTDDWEVPEDVYLYMGFVDGQIMNIPHSLPKISSKEIATYGLSDRDKRYTTFLHPIFFGNEQLGVVVFELQSENYTLIESLTVELGCALKLSSIFAMQKQTEARLEALSLTDELTGLYNRRGFFNKAQVKYIHALSQGMEGILFYADMDGLKKINDTYGHNEGDLAIIAMSNILKRVFSGDPIIGRIGGDEFVILCYNTPLSFMDAISSSLLACCKEYNENSLKPYQLSITLGGIPFSSGDLLSLEALLSKADKILYQAKENKKHRDTF